MNPRRRRIRETLRLLIRRGVAPRQLAMAAAAGIVVGNMPIPGVTTVLCTAIALVWRLNLAAIQAAQVAMGPTQILLFIPFVRLGEWLLGAPRQALSVEGARTLMAGGTRHTAGVLWEIVVHAGLAWLVVAAPAMFLLRALLIPVFEHAAARIAARVAPAAHQFQQGVSP